MLFGAGVYAHVYPHLKGLFSIGALGGLRISDVLHLPVGLTVVLLVVVLVLILKTLERNGK